MFFSRSCRLARVWCLTCTSLMFYSGHCRLLRPLMQLRLRLPTKLHMPILGNMLQSPGARTSLLNAAIVVTDCSSSPFRATNDVPRMHQQDTIQPKRESFSLRIRWERIVNITMESAPMRLLADPMSKGRTSGARNEPSHSLDGKVGCINVGEKGCQCYS